MKKDRVAVTTTRLEESKKWLEERGIQAEVNYIEVSLSETRESPEFGKFNTNRGGIVLGGTVAVDMTKGNAKEILEKVVDSMLGEAGHNLQTLMGSMK